nr:hypothetical protein [Tanacetum cinerariifolium]
MFPRNLKYHHTVIWELEVLREYKTLSVCEENLILLVTYLRDGEQVELLQFLHIIDIFKVQCWCLDCPFSSNPSFTTS